tara:strand:+ start:749 stop:1099 length:351 start_codon:yes stop_codon:yes gene_type:complete
MSKRNYRGKHKTETDTILNKAIGKKIKEARLNYIILDKKKTCSQTKLANALNRTFQQVQKYEKGKNGVSTIILIQISNFFGKPLEYFTSDATELLGQAKSTSNSSEVAPELNPELN